MVVDVAAILQHSPAGAAGEQSALVAIAASSVPPRVPSRRRRRSRRTLRPLHVAAGRWRWCRLISIRRSFETERGGQSFILKLMAAFFLIETQL